MDSCTSDLEEFTILWAMFDGSITVHWAFALPTPRRRQKANSMGGKTKSAMLRKVEMAGSSDISRG